jgi:uncharacterized membrane protein (Fun14 family)
MQPESNPIDSFFSGSSLVTDMGGPFIIGLAVGYFAKKMLRISLFLFGAVIVGAFLLDQSGIFHVSPDTLESMASGVGNETIKAGSFLRNQLDVFSGKGLSAGVGFLAGLKLG